MKVRRPERREAGENVIALVNVVLLLLVFFLLAGRLVSPLPFPVEPPETSDGEPAGSLPAVVLIGLDGQVAVDGRPTDQDLLVAEVARLLEAEPDRPLVVRADAAAEATTIISTLGALQSAGVGDVLLLTQPEP